MFLHSQNSKNLKCDIPNNTSPHFHFLDFYFHSLSLSWIFFVFLFFISSLFLCVVFAPSPSNHPQSFFLVCWMPPQKQRARHSYPYYRAQKAMTTTTAVSLHISLHIPFTITIKTGEKENAFWKKTRQKYEKMTTKKWI